QARPLSASVVIVRPMLGISRREVLGYLEALGQDYRTDATNVDTNWTRNRIRHELLPVLRERFNPQVDAAVLRLAIQAGEAEELIANAAEELADECVAVDAA